MNLDTLKMPKKTLTYGFLFA